MAKYNTFKYGDGTKYYTAVVIETLVTIISEDISLNVQSLIQIEKDVTIKDIDLNVIY